MTTLTDKKHQQLITEIQYLLAAGRAEAEKLARMEALKTYHAIGKLLVENNLTGSDTYGQAILEDISDEVDVDLRTLQYCIAFFKQYKTPTKMQITPLTWSHYKLLLGVNNPEKRKYYETAAAKKDWTVRDLRKAITVESYEVKEGDRASPKERLARPTGHTYIYEAEVVKILDGDTAIFDLSLGFDVWRHERIRLAGIDTPPINRKDGIEARDFVGEKLLRAKTIVVQTRTYDIYRRYIGHVLYSYEKEDKDDVFRKGHHLNEELLRAGLARKEY